MWKSGLSELVQAKGGLALGFRDDEQGFWDQVLWDKFQSPAPGHHRCGQGFPYSQLLLPLGR